MTTTTRTAYPRREPYFAQKFIRRLVKSAAAQEIGVDAFALLVVVATTEDAKRYSGPVTFYNGQLLPLLGFGKWERLDRARDAAVKAGWLHYAPPQSGHRQPGAYWVLTPDHAAGLSDSPVDEPPQDHYPDSGEGKDNPPPDPIPIRDTHRDTVRGTVRGTLRGNSLSYALIPNPNNVASGKKPTDGYTPEFESFWLAYPANSDGRKPKKAEAFKRWNKIPAGDQSAVIQAVATYSQSGKVRDGYVMNPTTFLSDWRTWAAPPESAAPRQQTLYPEAKPPRIGVRNRG